MMQPRQRDLSLVIPAILFVASVSAIVVGEVGLGTALWFIMVLGKWK